MPPREDIRSLGHWSVRVPLPKPASGFRIPIPDGSIGRAGVNEDPGTAIDQQQGRRKTEETEMNSYSLTAIHYLDSYLPSFSFHPVVVSSSDVLDYRSSSSTRSIPSPYIPQDEERTISLNTMEKTVAGVDADVHASSQTEPRSSTELSQVVLAQNGDDTEKRAPSDSEKEREYPTGLKRAMILIPMTLAYFLVFLDLAVVSTATPAITSEFNSLIDVGWYGIR